jgi:hypothetical protein
MAATDSNGYFCVPFQTLGHQAMNVHLLLPFLFFLPKKLGTQILRYKPTTKRALEIKGTSKLSRKMKFV